MRCLSSGVSLCASSGRMACGRPSGRTSPDWYQRSKLLTLIPSSAHAGARGAPSRWAIRMSATSCWRCDNAIMRPRRRSAAPRTFAIAPATPLFPPRPSPCAANPSPVRECASCPARARQPLPYLRSCSMPLAPLSANGESAPRTNLCAGNTPPVPLLPMVRFPAPLQTCQPPPKLPDFAHRLAPHGPRCALAYATNTASPRQSRSTSKPRPPAGSAARSSTSMRVLFSLVCTSSFVTSSPPKFIELQSTGSDNYYDVGGYPHT
jgi:hypothetical protein